MFTIGILIAVYAYAIFLMGLLGILYASVLWVFTVVFVGVSIFYCKKYYRGVEGVLAKAKGHLHSEKKDTASHLLVALLGIQIAINFVGVLGPELGFDALWYHLPLPKLYLISHSISYIPGGLLFYSTMPKLIELLYVGGLAFGSS